MSLSCGSGVKSSFFILLKNLIFSSYLSPYIHQTVMKLSHSDGRMVLIGSSNDNKKGDNMKTTWIKYCSVALISMMFVTPQHALASDEPLGEDDALYGVARWCCTTKQRSCATNSAGRTRELDCNGNRAGMLCTSTSPRATNESGEGTQDDGRQSNGDSRTIKYKTTCVEHGVVGDGGTCAGNYPAGEEPAAC